MDKCIVLGLEQLKSRIYNNTQGTDWSLTSKVNIKDKENIQIKLYTSAEICKHF